jgi:hypothetical protein
MARPQWQHVSRMAGTTPTQPYERTLDWLHVRDVVGGSRGRYDRRWVRAHLPTYQTRKSCKSWPGLPIPWDDAPEKYVLEPVPGEEIAAAWRRPLPWQYEAVVRLRRFPLPARLDGVVIGGPVTRQEGIIDPRGEDETGGLTPQRTISNLMEVWLVCPPVAKSTRLASIVLALPDDVEEAF